MRSLDIRLIAGSAALMLAAAAHAAPVSEWNYIGSFDQGFDSEAGFDQHFQSTQGFQSRFDEGKWAASGAVPALSLSRQTTEARVAAAPAAQSAYAVADSTRSRALAAKTDTALALGLGSSLDLTLWNFIANIRAQQQGSHFELLQTGVASIDYTLNNTVSAVPLPATTWLFLAGLLGLCGVPFGLGRMASRARPHGLSMAA